MRGRMNSYLLRSSKASVTSHARVANYIQNAYIALHKCYKLDERSVYQHQNTSSLTSTHWSSVIADQGKLTKVNQHT